MGESQEGKGEGRGGGGGGSEGAQSGVRMYILE